MLEPRRTHRALVSAGSSRWHGVRATIVRKLESIEEDCTKNVRFHVQMGGYQMGGFQMGDVGAEYPLSQIVLSGIESTPNDNIGGTDISIDDALTHVYGYAPALDMTRRDLQGEAKKLARPWEVGKAFERSAPCGAIVPASDIGHPAQGFLRLDVNGERRQDGDLNQMIWKVPEMISYLSGLFTLRGGDVILTGTPAGVGPVAKGDRLHGEIEGVGELDVTVA